MKKHCSSDSEDAGCMNTGFAKRILSKTSIKSSSSCKSGNTSQAEEISKLLVEIDQLKQNVQHLNNVIDNKDAAIGHLAREKESLYIELRKVQRINRNLHQQLEDERDFYQKEKEHYCEEINSIKRGLKEGQSATDIQSTGDLNKEIEKHQQLLADKDKIIYNLCVKYLRIKSNKNALKIKMDRLITQHQKAYDYIISLLEDSQIELDKLITERIQTNSASNKKYLDLVKRNAKLHYENTQLKIRLVGNINVNMETGDGNEMRNMIASKSDGKVPELRKMEGVRVKKTTCTQSQETTKAPNYINPRILCRKKYRSKPIELEYPLRFKTRTCSSDPG